MIYTEIAKPDWLEEALPEVLKSLEMVRANCVPESFRGFFVRTAALRLLRCLYGSDEATAVAIRQHVFDSIQMAQEMEKRKR